MSDRNWRDDSIEKRIEARKRDFRFPAFMPFFWLGLAAIAGSFLADLIRLPWYLWAVLLAIGLLSSIIHFRKRKSAPATLRSIPFSLILGAFALTAMLYQLSLPVMSARQLASYHLKGKVSLIGLVILPPEEKSSSLEVVVAAENIRVSGKEHEVEGKLLFYIPIGTTLKYGDRVEIWGELEKPEEGEEFQWREYLRHKGIYTTTRYPQVKVKAHDQGNPILAALYHLRDYGGRILTQIFPSPEDALLRGILLGDESAISKSMDAAYRRTGTSHIIAISGFNMAVLAGFVSLFLTQHLGAKRGALATIILLATYSLLVGGSPSVLRAAFMGAFTVIADVIARKGNTLNSLGLSALLMVLINPHLPWDLGFQFSFLATLGLALFAGPLQLRVEDWFQERFQNEKATKLASFLCEFLLLTLIAQAMVLPVSLCHFHQLSWLFLLANPLILPLQPAVMILGLIAMTGGMLSLPLGKVLAWFAWPFAALTNWIVISLARIPTESLYLSQFNLFWIVLYYFVLFAIVFRPKADRIKNQILKPEYLLIGLGALTFVVWIFIAKAPDGKLHIHLPQGEGQSFVLIEGSQGESLLLAGSPGDDSLVSLLSTRLPLFSKRLDAIIIPDCRGAQLKGLFQVIQKYEVDQVFWVCNHENNQSSRNLYALLEERNIVQQIMAESINLQNEIISVNLRLDEEKYLTLKIEYEETALLVSSNKDDRIREEHLQIASTGVDQEQGFSVFVDCQNCQLEELGAGNGYLISKEHAFWKEVTSNGQILSIFVH
jgi:competence protein ComEC